MDVVKSLSLLVFSSLASCSNLPRYPVPASAMPTGFYENRDTSGLALLEYRIARYFAQSDRPYPTVCAAAVQRGEGNDKRDPAPLSPEVEDRLLARFPGLSALIHCKRAGVGYEDGRTGAAAAVFDVHEIECRSSDLCSAWAGSLGDGPHGWSWYWIEWKRGAWRFRERPLDIVVT